MDDANNNYTSDSSDSAGLMYVRCAACGEWMDSKPGDVTQVSHGLCIPCYERQIELLDAEKRVQK